MRTVRVGGVIKRPVEDVFRVLSNPENAPKWSLNALEEELTSPPPVGVGSTRRAVVKSFGGRTAENHAVCTEFEPNRRIAPTLLTLVRGHSSSAQKRGWRNYRRTYSLLRSALRSVTSEFCGNFMSPGQLVDIEGRLHAPAIVIVAAYALRLPRLVRTRTASMTAVGYCQSIAPGGESRYLKSGGIR